jgi:hypothetical protein
MKSELTHYKKPIIGYVGYLASIRLDIDLLDFLAQSRPDWSIVLVGPEDSVFTHCKLHGYTNIHFLGAQDVNRLPEYIKASMYCKSTVVE